MNKKLNVYNYILKLSCDSDRKMFSTPFTRNGKLYATDSFMIVRMDPTLIDTKYLEGSIEAESVYKKDEALLPKFISINTGELLGILSEFEPFAEWIGECRACHGSGEGKCFHCGNESDCETCRGSGKSGASKPIHTIKFAEKTMTIDEIPFTPVLINKLAIIASVLNQDVINIEVIGSKAHINFPNVEILLMTQSH